MSMEKRMHPLKIIESFLHTLKNTAIVIFYVFIIKWGDDSVATCVLRLLIILFIVGRLVTLIIEWSKTSYLFSDQVIHVKRGVFKKKHHEMKLDQIQNIQRKTPFYFKVFGVTSLILNTKGSAHNASIRFEAVKMDEAGRIEQLLADYNQQAIRQGDEVSEDNALSKIETNKQQGQSVELEKDTQQNGTCEPSTQDSPTNSGSENFAEQSMTRTVHFRPTSKDLFKASFLSLSFLIIIPIVLTVYEKMKDVMNIERYIEGLLQFIKSSWLTIFLTVIILIIIAIIIGIVKTYLTYGKYEIASDAERIYLRSGLLNEKSLSIRKNNVQAVRIHQSLLKRWLHMSEIMLVSAGGDYEEEIADVQSLFPFLPTKRAFSLAEELLPIFQVHDQMKRLPKRALFMKMIRIPWLFLIVTGGVLLFKPAWWFGLPILFILTYVVRYFDYRNTFYNIQSEGIQFKSGGLSSVAFITTRKQVIEVCVKQSFIQQKLGLATIQTVNQGAPTHEEEVKDVPIEAAQQFMGWYAERFHTVEVE